MFYCLDMSGTMHKGKTLTDAFKQAEKHGDAYNPVDCEFFEGEEIKVSFEVVPATQVKIIAKATPKKKGTK